ncbi:MAG: glycoside hydrolase family 3 C-terminal domain-containing protein [Rikenellaceae bacterium]|nr:glycoside hydrolase family 3 C-terminal domain-containing protein [Rikenellaceae bacterium]
MAHTIVSLTSAAFLLLAGVSAEAQQTPPYKNPLLPTEVRVDDLLGRMTLDEKIAQIRHLHSWDIFNGAQLDKAKLEKMCAGGGYGFFEGFPLSAADCRRNFREIQTYLVEKTRLGIPGFPVAESLHGVVQDGATIFPQNIALGSTFDPELAYQKTKHIAGELNTMGVKQVLAPCIDVVRDLRWGRVEESFGEDPFLCSVMGIAEVKGYTDHGISPMLKHYGPHGNPTGGLNLASVECGVRDLFDIYLKPFEAVVAETPVMAVMSSYNSWNRIPNSASRFMLTDILRDKYGFRGYVYSDWGVIDMLEYFHKTAANKFEAASQAITAGLDVEASSNCYPALKEKVLSGEFDVRYIDQAVRRVLRAKIETGLFEDPYLERTAFRLPLRARESVELSRRIADESTVLLKNDGGLLPLDAGWLKSIAVLGPNADQVQFGDYTWSKSNADGVTPLQGIRNLLGDKVEVNYAKGCSITSRDTAGIAEAVALARRSDAAVIFVGSSSAAFVRQNAESPTSGEGIDLNDISLTGAQEQLIRAVHATGKPVVVVLVAGKPFAIPWVKEHIPAVLAQWYAGEQEGNSIADILFGKVNPSGKLTFSFPQSTGHLPAYYNYLPTDKGYYHAPGSYEKPGRDYVFASPAPLWAFGHGLSYTDFEYLDAATDKANYQPYDTIRIRVRLKNTGKMTGKEVVQAYVRDVVSTVVTPVKQLKGFTKLEAAPGEVVEGEIGIPVSELYLTDDSGNRYLEPGAFEMQVGTASDRIYFTLPVEVGTREGGDAVVRQPEIKAAAGTGKTIGVKGVVRDVQATPVGGVRVAVKGSNAGAVTAPDGTYSLKTKDNAILTFSKKGFSTREIAVGGQSDINVQLVAGE